MKEIVQYTENPVYELRSSSHFRRVNMRTVRFGSESIANLGTKILSRIAEEIKTSNTLDTFNSKIKWWCPQNCLVILCRTYVNHVGFID